MNLTTMRNLVRRDLKDETPTPQTPADLDDCDLLWTATDNVTVSLDSADYKQGIGCMQAIIASGFTTGLVAYHNISSFDLNTYQELRLWVKSTVNLSANVLYIAMDNSSNCASPEKYVALPALTSNVWHKVYLDLGDVSALTGIVSVGLHAASDPGSCTVRLDNIQVYKSEYKWSDDELERHIDRALKDYSIASPCQDSTTIATTPDSRVFYTTSYSTLITIYAVEYPAGQFPPSYQRFSFFNKKVTLLGDLVPDGSDVTLYYGKLHVLDLASSTIPDHHEDIVLLGAQAYALQAYASYSINVLQEGYRYAQERASADARAVMAQFRGELQKLKSKIRSRQLYIPTTSPVSRTIDFGP